MRESGCERELAQPRRVRRLLTRRIPDPLLRQLLEQAVSQVFIVASAELWSDTRGRPPVAFARQVAMYLAHVACGLTFTEIGQLFARDRTTVAHACGLIEDRRDDPALDRSLELLEGVLRFLSPPAGAFPRKCA